MCALQILILACWLGSESRLSKDTERWAGGSLPAWRADVPPKDWIDSSAVPNYYFSLHLQMYQNTIKQHNRSAHLWSLQPG